MQIIKETIARIHIGTPKVFRNLTVFPLSNAGETKPDYLVLDEALANGSAKITEVTEGGHVPQLKFINSCAMPILLLDGEELVGAKQNRVLNLTILVPPAIAVIIPVSCVEAGRWHHTSREFVSAPRTQYAQGRAAKMEQVSASMRHGSRASDQSAVWHGIHERFAQLGHDSPTAAMADLYEAESVRIEDFVKAFTAEPGQVGAVFAIGGRLIGFDLFDSSQTFQKLFAKLVRSYALDAIAEPWEKRRSEGAQPQAETILKLAAEAEASEFRAVGSGQDIRLNGPGISGAALIAEGRVVHLAAFAAGNGRQRRDL